MPEPWVKKVEDYVVTYPANNFHPRIDLVGEDGNYFMRLKFMPNGSELPSDAEDAVHYHLEDYANVLDLLRNRSPIYFGFNGSDGENGLQTGGGVQWVGDSDKE